MDMKLELVPIPVADVDRAKAFYAEQLGFVVDVDVQPGRRRAGGAADPAGVGLLDRLRDRRPGLRGPPGSVRGLHLVVTDIEAARAELIGRGVDVGEIQDVGRGVTYAGFEDPDGNGWTLQLMPWRTGDAF